jgi:hypothetical protein
MIYSREEISKAIDIAIASNSDDALHWVSVHSVTSGSQLECISKIKKITLPLKCKIATHDNVTPAACENFRSSNALELTLAIVGNKSLDLEYRKSWVTKKLMSEALMCIDKTTVKTSRSPRYSVKWRNDYFWNKKLDSFKAKLPADVWPEFENLLTVRDIIL